MARLIALKDNTLPAGIIGPPVVAAGRIITVSAFEAAILLATGNWEPYPPQVVDVLPMLDKTSTPTVRKAATVTAAPPEEEACAHAADNH